MGIIADQLAQISVCVESGDGGIQVELIKPSHVVIEFNPQQYRIYSEAELETQLAQLIDLLWSQYRKHYIQVTSHYNVEINTPAGEWDKAGKRYLAEASQLVTVGSDADRDVRVRTVGLKSWQVRIAPGTLARCEEKAFAARVVRAMQLAISQYHREVSELYTECFDTVEIANATRQRKPRQTFSTPPAQRH